MGRKKSATAGMSWRMKQFIKNPRASRLRMHRICKEEKLTEDFMRKYTDVLDWYDLSYHQDMSEDFIEENIHKIYARAILNRKMVSENWLRRFASDIDWNTLSSSQMDLSIDFLREFRDKIDWGRYLYTRNTLNQEMLEEFKDVVSWTNLIYKIKMDEDFIRKYMYEMKCGNRNSFWSNLTSSQHLSEKFLNEFEDRIDWRTASYAQELTEEQIGKHADQVEWKYIIQRQKLSEKFIKKHIDKISRIDSYGWRELLKNHKLGKQFMRKYKKNIRWYDVKRDIEYGTIYASKLDKEFVAKMVEDENKRYEKLKQRKWRY